MPGDTAETVAWGVLGVAHIALRAVIPAIQRAANGRLVAIASRDPSRAEDAARRLGVPHAHGSYEALLDDPEVQAVYIPLPNALHHRWSLACAAAGKHVLCEKPLALTVGECREMAAACRRSGVALMEAFMYRFHPRTEHVASLTSEGVLGDLRVVRAAFTFAASDPRTNIRFRPDLGGGALYDVGCYTVNVSRMLLGEPEEVFACGVVGASGVDEQVGAVLRFRGGRVALIDCGLTLPRRQEYEVVGTEGTATAPAAFLPGTADAEIHLVRGAERKVVSVPGTEQYQRMVEHFGDTVLGRAGPRLSPDDATANVRVLEALLASLRSGRPQGIAP
ncbi:MAG TPA: Gfo/Idh/MocA family oxidoreductase [bacterium]|nr:Gfo/Idh/MocA family oxidoreductase [bacterium]